MSREADVFADALEQPEDERAAFLNQACGGDAALRARVEALLRAHTQGRSFLPGPVAQTQVTAAPEPTVEVIAHYKLLEKIGEGGCGVVWLAEQGEPLRRQVAVKVIKLGMDTKEVIARFDAERHALAMMDHPNIAKVFDAGATAAGRPYFAMELVRGRRITDYCDANNLATPARLELFVHVCRAIQHAHVKGIIHRDIKPSNVMVAVHDGIAVPKVIDFGIAKATAGRLTDHTLYTAVEQMIGTPIYMSPEQIDPAGQDIDTRSDVYSLGVLLYELLAGRPPFDPKTLAEAGLEGMRRVIRESDPFKPSTRLSTLGHEERATVARQRGTDPHQLAKLLRGDLDWIVMRCLEKKRARRYETASELARDIEHFLHHEPVMARPPSAAYRLAKFAIRHKMLAASAATAAAVLVLVAGGASVVAVRARRAERAEAQQASRTDLTLGSRLIEEGRTTEGLAFLVRAAQSDPENFAIGPRLLSVLAYRSFPRPAGRPLTFVGMVRDAAYSADGRRVITVTTEGNWRWDRHSGDLVHRGATDAIFASQNWVGNFSSDFGRVAAGGLTGNISVLEGTFSRSVLPPLPHPGNVNNVFFSPSDRWLATAAGQQGSVKLWDAATGELKAAFALDLPRGEVIATEGIFFSRDSTRLLVTTRGTQWGIWQVPDGEPVVPVQRSSPHRLSGFGSFSPDGKLVLLTDAKGGQLYDATTGARHGPHLEHDDQCGRAAFSRDGTRVVTCSLDQVAKIWLVAAPGKPQFVLRHGHPVRQAVFTAGDRYLLTLASDDLVRIWDTATGELAVEPDRYAKVQRFLISPEGDEFLTFSRFESVGRRWRVPGPALAPFRLPVEAGRQSVSLISKASAAYVRYADRLQQITLPTLAPIGPPRRYPVEVKPTWVGVAVDGQTAIAVQGEGRLEVWNLQGKELARQSLPPFPVKTSLFQTWFWPGAMYLATHFDQEERCQIDLWNRLTAERVGPTIHVSSSVASLANAFDLSPDGRLLAVGTVGHGVELWDPVTGKKQGDSLVVPTMVSAARFSPDGRRLAVAAGNAAVQLWDPETRQTAGALLLHPYNIGSVEFFADSRRLLTKTWAEVRIWELASGSLLTSPLRPMLAPGDRIHTAMLRENDRLVAVITGAGVVRIYDSADGQLLLEPFRTTAPGPLFSFEATERYAAVANGAELSAWPLPPLFQQERVPEWLLRLATATAGGALDRFAAFRAQPAEAETFAAIRRELDRLPAHAPYAAWGRWILADPATRPPSPGMR